MDCASGDPQVLTNRLYERAGLYGIEFSREKSKIMINSETHTSTDVTMNCEKL
ncbi:hypothetical protein DPMN_025686 [Dreissena polymorpha]|uniref:Uncharacterized protein n=1 Tax=Dreissena polymorpha TaxID=45954 RepID=A0A9D4RDJ6_DREPO|nr:hypothetical protein DPMN_025686 [Dreissena polymorpha]